MKKLLAVIAVLLLCNPTLAQTIGSGAGGGGGIIPATGNIALSVNASTGNDNSCSSGGTACATIQRALTIAAGYNYLGKYTLAITVADGTYAVNGTVSAVTLPALVNYPAQVGTAASAAPSLTGDTATPANVIISNTSGDAVATDWFAVWTVKGFRLKSTSGTNADLNVQNYSSVQITNIDFAGNGTLALAQNYSWIGAITITSSTASAVNGLKAFFHSAVITDTGTWTINNSPTFSGNVLYISDYSVLGAGTYVNGNTVTGNRLFMFGYSYNEFAGSRAQLPGSGNTVTIDQPSVFSGDTNAFLGGCGNTSSSLANVIFLCDGAGNIEADWSGSNANNWTFQGQNPVFTSANTAFSGFVVNNTTTGAHEINLFTVGSAGISGLTAGEGGLFDLTSGNIPFWWDASANVYLWAGLCWGASSGGSFTVPTADSCLARLGAASFALGNGTPGDFSGTLKLAHLTATALANTATTSAVCYNTSTGVLTYDGTVGTCTTSDERLKNIGPRINDALSKLLSINGFYFTYKDQDKYGKGNQIGVGAQTVEKVFPELVETGSDGIKSVAYEKLAAPIIEAMRELKGENDKMRTCLSNWQCRLFGLH